MEKNESEYNFEKHAHNFAVWASARAVQTARKKCKRKLNTKNIYASIMKSGLYDFAKVKPNLDQEEFDLLHESFCSAIKKYLGASYGLAAKIVNIYLKVTILVEDKGESRISKVLHPPIDSILLKNFAIRHQIKDLRNQKWSKLNKIEYKRILNIIKGKYSNCLWVSEENWTPQNT